MTERLSKEDFIAEMKARCVPVEERPADEIDVKEAARKAKQKEYAKRSYERMKAKKAAAMAAKAEPEADQKAADPEENRHGYTLTAEEATFLADFIRAGMMLVIEADERFNNADAVFRMVRVADRLGGQK